MVVGVAVEVDGRERRADNVGLWNAFPIRQAL